MAKSKVLQLGIIDHAHEEWKALSEVADIVLPKATNPAEFLEEVKSGAFDDILVVYRTFQSVSITGLLDENLIKILPESIKFICHYGAGYDQVDVSACTARDIRVSNVPNVGDDATADVAMFLILGALRGFSYTTLALRRGEFRGIPTPPLGHDPRGKVLGILGMGGIGSNVSVKAKSFGMVLQYHNRRPLPEELSGGVKYVSFEELLSTSDVISLHIPLNKSTYHLISTAEIAKMKKGVVIVNTARGAVMDEVALLAALDSGHVFSAGLDVYEDEPTVPQAMIGNPHIFLLPHMGTYTYETQKKMEICNIDNTKSAVLEGKLISPVPEQKGM
ncbi:D-isomer specific 2-hydroxyacid dehydrogenase, NAD binding domain containing protein [Hyaloscypha variabilis]